MTTPKKQHGKWEVTLKQHRALQERVTALEGIALKLINHVVQSALAIELERLCKSLRRGSR